MGAAEIRAFLTHLAVQRNAAASTQNQALAALLFLYRQVLGIDLGNIEDVVRTRRPIRLPLVFTRLRSNGYSTAEWVPGSRISSSRFRRHSSEPASGAPVLRCLLLSPLCPIL